MGLSDCRVVLKIEWDNYGDPSKNGNVYFTKPNQRLISFSLKDPMLTSADTIDVLDHCVKSEHTLEQLHRCRFTFLPFKST